MVDAKSKAVFVITSIGKNNTVAFVRMTSKKATSVKLPSTIKLAKKLYKVTAIVDNAFKNYKKLTKVTLGSNITAIGKNAFSGCVRLKSIVIGKKVSKLGANLFKGCKKIKRITIKGSKLKTKLVSPRAFKGLSKKVVIKVPVKQLKYYKKIFKKKGFKGKVR